MPDEATRIGRYVETAYGAEVVRAYVPPSLPPIPSVRLDTLLSRLSAADQAVGRLDGISVLLPDKGLFLYMYVRKEAVLSSQIEGTQSTLFDLLKFEAEAAQGRPIDDIREVSNYVAAMLYGLDRLTNLPLSLRLIREMHERLLQSGRGQSQNPGEFRRSTKLDWRHTAGQRAVRAAAAERGDAMPRCAGEIHT
jgi:Fic family protein